MADHSIITKLASERSLEVSRLSVDSAVRQELLPIATEFEVVDIRKSWTAIRPWLDSTDLQRAHTAAMHRWIGKRSRWTTAGALAGRCRAPWELTKTDFWATTIDARIEEAMKQDSEDAHYASAAETAWHYAQGDDACTKAERNAIRRVAAKACKVFEPTPDADPDWWWPRHSCFWIGEFAQMLATAWMPTADWWILEGDVHATIISLDSRLCFDPLLFEFGDQEPSHPVAFALSESAKTR